MWTLTAASITLFRINEVRENKKYFRQAVNDNFKFSLILEFITGLYTFSLPVELILLPIMALIGMMLAVAETDTKYDSTKKFLNGIVSMVGLITIIYCIYKTVEGFKEFTTLENLINFALPIFLAIWFLPFIYFLSLYMECENNFVSMGNAIKEPNLLRYAKRAAILQFGLNREGLERWKKSLFLREIKTKQDVLDSITAIKDRQEIEANPPQIDEFLGWSPFEAKEFLLSLNIETGHYQNSYDGEWFAISKPVKLDGEFMGSNITYSVVGSSDVVTELALGLKHYNTSQKSEAHAALVVHAAALSNAALHQQLPQSLVDAIQKGQNKRIEIGNKIIEVKKEKWPTGLGYNIDFTIKHS